MALDWFYFLPPHSFYNFEKATDVFLTQYASRREAKKNNHHFLNVKIRKDDSLKLAKVFHCDEDVFVLAFISGLQVSHPLYKHLLKYDVTQMSEVLSRAQPCFQL